MQTIPIVLFEHNGEKICKQVEKGANEDLKRCQQYLKALPSLLKALPSSLEALQSFLIAPP
jgi:hypothetical protein